MDTWGGQSALLVFLTLCAVMGAYGCRHFYLLWKGEEKRRQRQREILDAAEAKYFSYEAAEDTLILAPATAAMFGMSEKTNDYSALNRNAVAHEERIRLKNLDAMVGAGDADKELRIFRHDVAAPGIFHVIKKTFVDENGHDELVLGVLIDKTAAAANEAQTVALAQTDNLTHIYNSAAVRGLIRDRLATYDGKELAAFALVNIDGFKEINNKLGHQIGDRVLLLVASTLKEILRSNDYVGRLGGDEFCVYFTKIPNAELMPSICERVNKQVTARVANEEISETVTVSIGCTVVKLKDDFKALYKRADQALYHAKESGRNNYCIEL